MEQLLVLRIVVERQRIKRSGWQMANPVYIIGQRDYGAVLARMRALMLRSKAVDWQKMALRAMFWRC
jgi:hypothetical protein